MTKKQKFIAMSYHERRAHREREILKQHKRNAFWLGLLIISPLILAGLLALILELLGV